MDGVPEPTIGRDPTAPAMGASGLDDPRGTATGTRKDADSAGIMELRSFAEGAEAAGAGAET